MLYNSSEKRILLSAGEVDYIKFGRGERNLIMIQGLNTRGIRGAADSLAYMYRSFAKDYTVYLFDRRPDVFSGISVRDFALDIAEAMDALGIKNADVFGVSQGGMIGQYLAILRPDLVGKLVLAVTIARSNETVEAVINSWIEMSEQGRWRELVYDMAEKMYSDEYVKRYKPMMPLLTLLQKPKDVNRFVILAKSCLNCNAYEELEKIKCPTFVIGGALDKVVGVGGSYEIAEKLGCELYVYENLGHAAYEEAKDFNKRVLDFLL